MAERSLKYPPEFKQEVCEYALKDNIVGSSKYYKISRKTVSKWIKIYQRKGTGALGERKKRQDSQPAKIDRELLSEIVRYKKDNPGSTLKNIRDKFSLECSLPLLCVKLNKQYRWKTQKKDEQNFYVTYGIIKDSLSGDIRKRTYRFELYDSLHKNIYFGLSQDCSIRNLCVFIRYVLTFLENAGLKKNNAKIVTNITFLIRSSVPYSDYDKMIRNEFGIGIFHKDNIRTLDNSIKKDHNSLKSVYRESVLNCSEHYIPPLRIEDILRQVNISDTPERKWLETISNHKVVNQLMIDAVKQIELFADQAKIDFDFDKALNFYGKIYQTTVRCPESEIIKISVLFKKAMIYYHLDSYAETKSALFEILDQKENCRKRFGLGQVHYYLGIVFRIENDLKRSSYHFDTAVRLLYESPRKNNLYIYYQAVINRHINTENYKTALIWANKYLRLSKQRCLTEQICKAYDLRGIVYFYMKKYYKSAKDFKSQLHLSQENGLLVQEIKAIYNLFSVSPHFFTDEHLKHIDRLTEITKHVKTLLPLHNCNNQLGNYYFRAGQYETALDYYKNEVFFYKKINDRFYYYRNLHYLALCNYYLGNYNTALRNFSEICAENNINNYDIISHSYNFMGRIYDTRNDIKKSLRFFRKSIKFAKESNYKIMIADSIKSIGYVYMKNGCNKKALRYFIKALREFDKIKMHIGTDLYNNNIDFLNKNIHNLHNIK